MGTGAWGGGLAAMPGGFGSPETQALQRRVAPLESWVFEKRAGSVAPQAAQGNWWRACHPAAGATPLV